MTTTEPTGSPTRSTDSRRGGFFSKIALVLALVLVVALVVFVLQNTDPSQVEFIGWNFELAQSIWLLGAALVGSVITLATTAAFRVRRVVR
ncbi:LapA family protein [Rhodococcus sp. G-MC3]|uniref:LapA family protein n=1 Tax=Rhodococcus sp. G-MC3 TaxID=3046209 RepID=UPI0024B93FD9|nr:LapA family protein [Rhodococcus sp. G-MC3]MDJ0392905.1 LapA family protein [Rhodococcus sp. G-MC3]